MSSMNNYTIFPWDTIVYFESYYELTAEQRAEIQLVIRMKTQRPYRVIEDVQGL